MSENVANTVSLWHPYKYIANSMGRHRNGKEVQRIVFDITEPLIHPEIVSMAEFVLASGTFESVY